MSDKEKIIEMLERVKASYVVSDKYGNSILIEHSIEFLFNANDMLEHVDEVSGRL